MVDIAGATLGGFRQGLSDQQGLRQAEENRLRLQRQEERQGRLDQLAQDKFQFAKQQYADAQKASLAQTDRAMLEEGFKNKVRLTRSMDDAGVRAVISEVEKTADALYGEPVVNAALQSMTNPDGTFNRGAWDSFVYDVTGDARPKPEKEKGLDVGYLWDTENKKPYTYDASDPEQAAKVSALIAEDPNRFTKMANYQGDTDDLSKLGRKEQENLDDAEISARNFMGAASDFLGKLEKTPELLSNVAAFAGAVEGAAAEAQALVNNTVGWESDAVKDITSYKGFMDDLGVKNAGAQTQMFSLALMYAAASGLGSGRELSDKDVKNAMVAVGDQFLASTEMRKAKLVEAMKQVDRNFRNFYKVKMGKDFEGDLGYAFGAESALDGLEIGTIEGGYRYIGPDPADPNSWEAVSG